MNAPTKDSKWKLCLVTEHSTDLRSEIHQIYLHMWLYYKNYMEKVDLGVLDTCDRIMGFGLSVTETGRFYLSIRDDYLMVNIYIVLIHHNYVKFQICIVCLNVFYLFTNYCVLSC